MVYRKQDIFSYKFLPAAGLRVALLMSWQERLSGLQELGSWELALLIGLDILQTASRSKTKGARPTGLLRGEGQGADINQVTLPTPTKSNRGV